MSAMKMEKNGRNSCTGNLRHIDVRYFFVKDRIDKGEMEVQYCPSHEMLADYFTKPLQGSLFNRLRDVIMGYKHIDTLKIHKHLSLKERVVIPTKEERSNERENRNVRSNAHEEQKKNTREEKGEKSDKKIKMVTLADTHVYELEMTRKVISGGGNPSHEFVNKNK